MIRTIFKAEDNSFTIKLPDHFLGKEIELIAFIVEEVKKKIIPSSNNKSFNAIQIDTKGFTFNRDEANER